KVSLDAAVETQEQMLQRYQETL
ncbi:MAG: hypothetical protein RIS97_224, partial [Pseudomonadota bacterium]